MNIFHRIPISPRKADVLTCIAVLDSEFACCAPKNYELGCASCEALRLIAILKVLVSDGHYDEVSA
jgi:hypothetical protein